MRDSVCRRHPRRALTRSSVFFFSVVTVTRVARDGRESHARSVERVAVGVSRAHDFVARPRARRGARAESAPEGDARVGVGVGEAVADVAWAVRGGVVTRQGVERTRDDERAA